MLYCYRNIFFCVLGGIIIKTKIKQAMRQFLKFTENTFIEPLEKISKNRYLVAIAQSLLAIFPLSLVGSLFLTITTIPFPETWSIKQLIDANTDVILVPYRLTLVLITIYLVSSIGGNLAKSYDFNPISGSIVALAAFLMTQIPVSPASMVPDAFLEGAIKSGLDTSWMQGLEDLGWVLPQVPMSGKAVYIGILAAIFGVEVLHFSKWIFSKNGKKAKQHIQLPSSVRQTIETIIPILLIVVSLFVIRDVIGFSPLEIISDLFDKLIDASSSYLGAIFFSILMSLVSFFGIIGFKISNSPASLSWRRVLTINHVAYLSGASLPKIVSLPFFYFFVWIGGSGSTLCLIILLMRSKSHYLRKLGQASLIPSLFNINSPVLYGMPVVLNPYLLIPYVLAPVVTTSTTYFCMYFNLIARPHRAIVSSMPFLVGAYSSTGDWKAIVLSIINLLIGVIIYYPFFKMYEDKVLKIGDKNIPKSKKENISVTTVD